MKQAVIVTGALGGIGRALCLEFAAAGYTVLGVDRTAGALDDVRLINTDVRALVTDSDLRTAFLREVMDALQGVPLTALVNNAAIQILGGTEQITLEQWRETLDTNLLAPFTLAQMFLPALSAANGSVINIASIHATVTKPGFVCYATSKAALVGLTKSMAVDLGARIRVNAILPAAVSTPMLLEGFAGAQDKLLELGHAHPLGRIATPREVAQAAVYLASDGATFMTGACLQLDGGIGARLHDPL